MKEKLHSRNKNRENYDFESFIISNPKLRDHLTLNKSGLKTIDFSNPLSVKFLNTALLNHYYGIRNWDFPSENLCPPIPGRADYIHYVADLLGEKNGGLIPRGNKVSCLDIGLGASCIYPIIGVVEYGWNFTGSDTNTKSVNAAKKIVDSNPALKKMIKCVVQKNPDNIFKGIMSDEMLFDVVICNPPFHSSIKNAQKESKRKIKNLTGDKPKTVNLNFAGINSELIYKGGEFNFIQKMIKESYIFSSNCLWFTTLISKQSNLNSIYNSVKKSKAKEIKIIPMGTGNKKSRIIAWSFKSKIEQFSWSKSRWK